MPVIAKSKVLSPKKNIAKLLKDLPDNCSYEDIQYHLYVMQKIERGLKESQSGKGYTTEIIRNSAKLIKYIRKLKDFELKKPEYPYGNIGATIIDGILQAGINYDSVVQPRVEKFRKQYPKIVTTSAFNNLIKNNSLEEILNFKGKKINLIKRLVDFLLKEKIESEHDFKKWLGNPENIKHLKNINGIKNKTADYFAILCGLSTNAVDRYSTRLISKAGIKINNNSYEVIKSILNKAADILNVDRSLFDFSVWSYMSQKNKNHKIII